MTKIKRSLMVKAKQKGSPASTLALCELLRLSRSSFYARESLTLSSRDERDVEPIRTLFEERKKRIGIRQIQMLLSRRYKIQMNRKKIARLKTKFGLVTKIRRRCKYKIAAAANVEHRACKNILNRNFNPPTPRSVYSTDITEVKYANGSKKAYIVAFKDLATNEIVASEVTPKPSMELVTRALFKAVDNLSIDQLGSLLIHSDQGFHFTHESFRNHLKTRGITQSMSRRGNCLDNAPIESFFGHIKDHLDTDRIESIDEVKNHVTKEIDYYNHERPQLRLKKMPPAFYRINIDGRRFRTTSLLRPYN